MRFTPRIRHVPPLHTMNDHPYGDHSPKDSSHILARLASTAGVGRHSSALILATLLTAGSGFVSNVIIAREFGPAGRGYYAVAIASIMAVAQVASLGLGEALAVHLAKHGGPPSPRIWMIALWSFIITMGAVAIGIHANSWIVIIGVATSTCFLQGTTFVLAFGASRTWIIAQLIQPFGVLSASLAALFMDVSIQSILLVYATSPLLGCLVCVYALPPSGSGNHGYRVASKRIFILGFQRQLTVTALALIRSVDVLALGYFASLQEVGPYAVAISLVNLALVAPWVLSGVVLRNEIMGTPHSRKNIIIQMGGLTAGPIVAVLATGWWLIPHVWGPEFHDSYYYFVLTAPGAIALGATRGLLSWRVGRGEQGIVVRRFLVFLLPAALIVAWGAATFGAVGAAVSSSATYCVLLAAAALRHRVRTDRIDRNTIPPAADPPIG